jgi:hypothetical protein
MSPPPSLILIPNYFVVDNDVVVEIRVDVDAGV